MKQAALYYATVQGWPVLPCNWMEGAVCSCGDPECRSPGKHPLAALVPRGLHGASMDALTIEAWFDQYPQANVAIRTGQGLAVLDLDRKPGADGVETIKEWERTHGRLPETLTAHTGGGGLHCYFLYDKSIKIPSRVNVLGPGVDIRADGGYVLAPPSNHKSGKPYEWDPTFGTEDTGIAFLPPELLAALTGTTSRQPELPGPDTTAAAVLDAAQVNEIVSALGAIPAEDRDTWLQVGMALQSTRAGEQAYTLWTDWSMTCPAKFNARDQRRTWRSFAPNHGRTLSTLFWIAKGCGWVEPIRPTVDAQEAEDDGGEHETVVTPPAHLLAIPGVLQDYVDWHNRTASVLQPQFAVQAALGLGSVALGRNWVTDRDNFSALYLLCVGDSGCGKEHAKYGIQQVLLLAGEARLLNGAGYTSDGAVYSSLLDRPAHIAVIDEIGLMLEGTQSKGNYVGASALKVMMEAWGSCHGAMLPKAYSQMGLTPEQREKQGERVIHNPCLTIMGLTTAGQFYRSLSSQQIVNGFLNRWLVVETAYGMGTDQDVYRPDPPSSVIEWVQWARRPRGNLPIANNALLRASPNRVPVSVGAMEVFNAYAREVKARRIELKPEGLDELLSRAREMAMRVGLIVAVSDRAEEVRAEHAAWAVDYVRFYSERLLAKVHLTVADTAYEALQKSFLAALAKLGKQGVTQGQMCKLNPFRQVDTQKRRAVLADLAESGQIVVLAEQGKTKPVTRYRIAHLEL